MKRETGIRILPFVLFIIIWGSMQCSGDEVGLLKAQLLANTLDTHRVMKTAITSLTGVPPVFASLSTGRPPRLSLTSIPFSNVSTGLRGKYAPTSTILNPSSTYAVVINNTALSTWQAINLSSVIPVGAKMVFGFATAGASGLVLGTYSGTPNCSISVGTGCYILPVIGQTIYGYSGASAATVVVTGWM